MAISHTGTHTYTLTQSFLSVLFPIMSPGPKTMPGREHTLK